MVPLSFMYEHYFVPWQKEARTFTSAHQKMAKDFVIVEVPDSDDDVVLVAANCKA